MKKQYMSSSRRLERFSLVVLLFLALGTCLLLAAIPAKAADVTLVEQSNPVYDPPSLSDRAYYPCVLYDASQFSSHGASYYYKMWFTGQAMPTDTGNRTIGYATYQVPDLTITKTGSPDPVVVDQNITYTITVNNAGPSDAQDVVVTDTLPSGVTFVSTSGCAGDPNGVPTCNLGTITAGGSKQYTVTVTVKTSTTGTITNNVSVSSSTTDPTPGNNTASAETTVSDTTVPVPVPSMNELGMIIFILLAGCVSIYYIGRYRKSGGSH